LVGIAAAVRSDKPSRQMLAGWAGVMILLGVVDEVLPGEQAALIGHLVGHDQMVLGVDGDLYIVADGACRTSADRTESGR